MHWQAHACRRVHDRAERHPQRPAASALSRAARAAPAAPAAPSHARPLRSTTPHSSGHPSLDPHLGQGLRAPAGPAARRAARGRPRARARGAAGPARAAFPHRAARRRCRARPPPHPCGAAARCARRSRCGSWRAARTRRRAPAGAAGPLSAEPQTLSEHTLVEHARTHVQHCVRPRPGIVILSSFTAFASDPHTCGAPGAPPGSSPRCARRVRARRPRSAQRCSAARRRWCGGRARRCRPSAPAAASARPPPPRSRAPAAPRCPASTARTPDQSTRAQ